MKKNTNHTNENYITELYNDAEKAVFIALRARHEKSGLTFLAELQNAQTTDNNARNNNDLIIYINQLEKDLEPYKAQREELTDEKAHAQAQAKRIRITQAERDAWNNKATELTQAIAELDKHIKPMTDNIELAYKKLSVTLSDRADIVQDVILFLVDFDHDTTKYFDTDKYNEWLELNELDNNDENYADYIENLRFRLSTNTAGRSISALATPDAMNRTTTKVHKATPQEVAEWLDTHGGQMGKGYKVPVAVRRARMSDCYDTLEYKDTKTQKGYYIVRHWVTIAPYQYIENYADENGENDIAYLKSYNPFVSNFADIERIEELAELKNLTEREREFLKAFASRCRYEGDFTKCKVYAFQSIGITSRNNQDVFFNRLKNKLK